MSEFEIIASKMKIVIVVPCYNESKRLQQQTFLNYTLAKPFCEFLFVNDGSTDNTAQILTNMSQQANMHWLDLPQNSGKAEAVRRGMLHAQINFDVDYIGFWDADLATPLSELDALIGIIKANQNIDIIMGLRLLRLGAKVKRTRRRHILGRIFATCASMILGLSVYDTQCGAKIFKSAIIPTLCANTFVTKWLFDVEILARYIKIFGKDKAITNIFESPLMSWAEIKGSKVKLLDFLKAPLELVKIWYKYIK